jgi:hypothetical protein
MQIDLQAATVAPTDMESTMMKRKPGAPKAIFEPYVGEHMRRRGAGEALPFIQDEGRALVKWADRWHAGGKGSVQTRQALAEGRAHPVDRYSLGLPCAGFERLDHYLRAAGFPLPGLVAPVSVVPSAVPLAVPALGVIPDEKPVWGDAPAPGLLLAL